MMRRRQQRNDAASEGYDNVSQQDDSYGDYEENDTYNDEDDDRESYDEENQYNDDDDDEFDEEFDDNDEYEDDNEYEQGYNDESQNNDVDKSENFGDDEDNQTNDFDTFANPSVDGTRSRKNSCVAGDDDDDADSNNSSEEIDEEQGLNNNSDDDDEEDDDYYNDNNDNDDGGDDEDYSENDNNDDDGDDDESEFDPLAPENDPNPPPSSMRGDMDDENEDKPNRIWLYTKLCIVLALLVMVMYVGIDSLVNGTVERKLLGLLEWMQDHTAGGIIVLIIVFILVTTLFIPSTLLMLGSGFVFADKFGLGVGTLIASFIIFVGAGLGGMLAFGISRFLLRDWVVHLTQVHPLFTAFDLCFESRGSRIIGLLRLSPMIPFTAISYSAGLTSIGTKTYAWSLYYILPYVVMYVFLGATANDLQQSLVRDHHPLIKIMILIVAIVFGLGAIILILYYTKEEHDIMTGKKVRRVKGDNSSTADEQEQYNGSYNNYDESYRSDDDDDDDDDDYDDDDDDDDDYDSRYDDESYRSEDYDSRYDDSRRDYDHDDDYDSRYDDSRRDYSERDEYEDEYQDEYENGDNRKGNYYRQNSY